MLVEGEPLITINTLCMVHFSPLLHATHRCTLAAHKHMQRAAYVTKHLVPVLILHGKMINFFSDPSSFCSEPTLVKINLPHTEVKIFRSFHTYICSKG